MRQGTSYTVTMAVVGQSSTKQTGPQMDMTPRAINVGAFAVARADEINTMMRSISTNNSIQRIFQRLPRHMRRRAMSHNIRRMPRRLRENARIQAEKSVKKKPKQDTTGAAKKSRRHRRRPGNLREMYAKRQMRNRWMETHIWHAKRFKMVERWGWKIPLHPSDKSARAVYRATARHCVISDISYHQVIEVQGTQVNIVSAMKHLTSPHVGLTMASRAYLHGTRHSGVLLYHRDTYPHGAICPVDYLWHCELHASMAPPGAHTQELNSNGGDDDSKIRKLWMWIHPSCWKEVIAELKAVCSEYNVSVTPLEDELLRFRLQGPLAHPVLLDALQVATVTPHETFQDERDDGSDTLCWWEKYYRDESHLETFKQQATTWKKFSELQSTSEIPTNAVISLVVRDPRVVLPKKRTKIMVDPDQLADEPSNQRAHKLPRESSISPLWSPMVRESVASEQKSNHELNQLRSDLLVPGTDLNLGRSEARIPVLLLHHPGIRTSACNEGNESTGMLGYGGGWDLVVPRKWGMAFWMGLVYRGARACGLREADKVSLHCSMPRYPYDFPDSDAGRTIGKCIADDLQQTFLKKPPAKRPNHGKLGIAAPFCPPWFQLIKEWVLKETGEASCAESVVQGWYVLRNKEKLDMLRTTMQGWSKKQGGVARKQSKLAVTGGKHPSNIANSATSKERKELPDHLSLLEPVTNSLVPLENRTFVWVGLHMVNRGFPSQFAIVCLPSNADLAELARNPNYGGPEEPVHKEFCLPKKRKLEKSQKGSNAKKVKVTQEHRPKPPSTPADFGYVSKDKMDLPGKGLDIAQECVSSGSNVDSFSLQTTGAPNSGQCHDDKDIGSQKKTETIPTVTKSNTDGVASCKTSTLTDAKSSNQGRHATGAASGEVMTSIEQSSSPVSTPEVSGSATFNTDAAMKVPVQPQPSESKSSETSPPITHKELLTSCTRSIIGFVTNGAQSFSCGKGMGVGFCATLGLINLMRASPRGRKLVVLVRDVQSLQYRFAYIYIPS
ncbi:ribonucleases P/MRP protein subunit POP1-like isoform X2 [Lytechinus pictus]